MRTIYVKLNFQVSQAMHDFHHGDSVVGPPAVPKDWGTQRFDRPPPPPKYQDMVEAVAKASTNHMLAKKGAADDDTASIAGSNYSFPEEVRQQFWPGINAEKHYRFLGKLRDTMYERYQHKYAQTRGTQRLFVPKDDLVDRFARQEVRKLFESSKSRDVTVDEEGNRRLTFEKFRGVLKMFRTPGQPFATWDSMMDLYELCDNGNIKVFFQACYSSRIGQLLHIHPYRFINSHLAFAAD